MLPQGNGQDDDVEITMVMTESHMYLKPRMQGASAILNKLGLVK